MVPKIPLSPGFSLSRLVHGQMRLHRWNLAAREFLNMIGELVDLGVTTFDHADIYGDYRCESLLGEALLLDGSLRDRLEIVTKCGIRLIPDKFPNQRVKHYDYSYGHIIGSVEQSLRNFRTDRIDLLLLHRPAPFFDPETVAAAFSCLKQAGKVLHFGVSNFLPAQTEMLLSHLGVPLVTNQVEISPYCLEQFENGNMEYFLQHGIRPMAWSPLAGGRLFTSGDPKAERIVKVLRQIGDTLGNCSVEKVAYAWLYSHPAGIIPVAGTGRIDRIREAAEALDIRLSLEQWYRIYIAARGTELP